MKATTEKKLARHWIDGAWVDSATHRESFNPATGEVIGSYAHGGRAEAEQAVVAAYRVFREADWKHNHALRSRVLNEMADRFETRANDLAQLLAMENGKLLPEAGFEVGTAPTALRYYAAL